MFYGVAFAMAILLVWSPPSLSNKCRGASLSAWPSWDVVTF